MGLLVFYDHLLNVTLLVNILFNFLFKMSLAKLLKLGSDLWLSCLSILGVLGLQA